MLRARSEQATVKCESRFAYRSSMGWVWASPLCQSCEGSRRPRPLLQSCGFRRVLLLPRYSRACRMMALEALGILAGRLESCPAQRRRPQCAIRPCTVFSREEQLVLPESSLVTPAESSQLSALTRLIVGTACASSRTRRPSLVTATSSTA